MAIRERIARLFAGVESWGETGAAPAPGVYCHELLQARRCRARVRPDPLSVLKS